MRFEEVIDCVLDHPGTWSLPWIIQSQVRVYTYQSMADGKGHGIDAKYAYFQRKVSIHSLNVCILSLTALPTFAVHLSRTSIVRRLFYRFDVSCTMISQHSKHL